MVLVESLNLNNHLSVRGYRYCSFLVNINIVLKTIRDFCKQGVVKFDYMPSPEAQIVQSLCEYAEVLSLFLYVRYVCEYTSLWQFIGI